MGEEYQIAGIILTGGLLPHKGVLRLMKEGQFPILLSEDDTYTTTKKVHERRVKIRATDEYKVKEAADLVSEYLDLEEIIARI